MSSRWPQMMRKATAVEYCDLSEAAFLREVACGRLPPGVTFGGREHWHKEALDKALDLLTGAHVDDWEKDFWNRGKAA